MALPKQVEEAAQLAEELHGKMYTQEPQEDSTDENVPQIEDQPDTSIDEDEEDNSYEPEPEDLEELRKFKARYLSLKGKYDKEVPRLQHEIKDFKQSVFEKLEQFQADSQKQSVQEPIVDKYTQFKEEYGEDFVESLRALIKAEAEERIKETIKPVQDQVLSVEETQLKAAQQSFMVYLDSSVNGDWRALWEGQDPKFIEFIQQPDPSGLYTYVELMQQYNDNWDAERLSKVFNIYLESSKPKKPSSQPNPVKEAMVAPSRQSAHTAPKDTDKRIWTGESIKEFQKNDRMNKYPPEESKLLWDDLLAAMAENRIR